MSDIFGGSFGQPVACSDGVCGTGLSKNVPKPGDPDLNSSLISATPAFGGIDVSWLLPTVNPFALAHVKLFRGLYPDFTMAVQHAVVAGDSYYDKSAGDAPQQYFYWIVMVSVNGTYGDPIGPASATARGTIEDTLTQLAGRIDSGVLASSLKNEIGKITLFGNDLQTEVQNRMAANQALGTVIDGVQQDVIKTMTFVQQEIIKRTDANSALVQEINVLASAVNNNIAALSHERTVRTQQDEALASEIQTATTILNGDVATGQVGLTTQINTLNGKVSQIGALYTAKLSVNGLIGGFGVYNDGKSVEAGFDVDRFWIGRTSENKRKPFIVQNDQVFIDEAVINKLTFNKLRDEAGNFVVENGKIKADYLKVGSIDLVGTNNFKVKSAMWGARMEMDSESIKIYDENGRLRVVLGKLV